MVRAPPFGSNKKQIFAKIAPLEFYYNGFGLRLYAKIHSEGNLFTTGNFEALPMFHYRDLFARFKQTGLRSCVEPRHAAAQQFYVQFVPLEVNQIQIGNLQLSAR